VKHLVNVSGGMASAVALFRVLDRFGPADTFARFADVGQESADLYRFLDDVQRAAGIKIERLESGGNCWDVWLDGLMFTNPQTGGCLASWYLKKLPLAAHAARVGTPEDTTIYVGFGLDEDDRMERLIASGAPWKFDFPLTWSPVLGRCDLADECRRRGVEPSNTYELGYPHDNCGGACILAGQKQWAGLLIDDRELYLHNERKEQVFLARQRAAGRKERTILKDRRGGVTRNLSLKQFREEIESGKRTPDDSWRETSCSCMGTLFQ
jgi:hypothetical protein